MTKQILPAHGGGSNAGNVNVCGGNRQKREKLGEEELFVCCENQCSEGYPEDHDNLAAGKGRNETVKKRTHVSVHQACEGQPKGEQKNQDHSPLQCFGLRSGAEEWLQGPGPTYVARAR